MEGRVTAKKEISGRVHSLDLHRQSCSNLIDTNVAQTIKDFTAMLETWVQSLSQEDPPREGNGNPLQYSCLKNPTDRGAWQATVHGITKSRT